MVWKKKLAVATMALAATIGAVGPAAAGRYGHGGPYGYYGPSYYGAPAYGHRDRRGISNGAAVALGVGALGLGVVLSNAFDKDRPGRTYDRANDRTYDRGYGTAYGYDERARLETERLRLENERLRLENERQRRALDDGEDDFSYGAYGARDARGDLDGALLGAAGRVNYDRAFRACLAAADRDVARRGLATAAWPATWDEAQPLGTDAVRFRANVDRSGRSVELVCEADLDGVRRVDFAGF
ncbi:MAG: hypothetical protein K2Q06_08570 [Parvularculaceae bacterium]|nr:hypothetical protein [Parvularculaceae bacterium]